MTAAEELARLKKAIALADVIAAAHIRVSDMEDGAASLPFWIIACEGARFRDYEPSKQTQEVTIKLLRDREAAEKRISGNR